MVTPAHRYFCFACILFCMQVLLGFDLQINLDLTEQLNEIEKPSEFI
jgi:hypothetical protein